MLKYLKKLFTKQMFHIENGVFKLDYFLYEVVHHCNLKCKGCDHCAPLADPEFVDLTQYSKDIKRMSELFPDVKAIGIMGGEPLLHPSLLEIIKITRNNFSSAKINLYSNGILLQSQKEEFWNVLKQNNVKICITFYDIDINFKKVLETAKKFDVEIYTEREYLNNKLPFDKIKYDINGKQASWLSHFLCRHSGRFPSLEYGKLYKCTIMCGARHFNKYFNKNMVITEKDYIDIYKEVSQKELIDYFEKSNPFCKYCNILGQDLFFWERSKKDIKEWT